MKSLAIFVAFLGLCSARPEPPVGYNYPQPSGSYGAPHGGSLETIIGGQVNSGYISHGLTSSGSGSSHFTSGASDGYATGFGGGYQQAIVQKHIYVHVPPPEPQEHRIQHIPQAAPPQKHYKIIFIKAPTPPTPTAPVIPLQAQNEEKTLVYVLVKKPDEQPDIVIPTPAPTQPSKPEVYFIKYKTQKDSHGHGIGVANSGLVSSISTGGSSSIETSGGQYGPPLHVPGTPIH